MGQVFYRRYPIFKGVVDKCEAIYRNVSGISLKDSIGLFDDVTKEVYKVEYTLPAILIFQIATVRLLESFGISPDIVVGHSFGELAMLHISGIFEISN